MQAHYNAVEPSANKIVDILEKESEQQMNSPKEEKGKKKKRRRRGRRKALCKCRKHYGEANVIGTNDIIVCEMSCKDFLINLDRRRWRCFYLIVRGSR